MYKQLVDATADFVCQSMQPICTVDEPSFRCLLEIAEPQFQLLHRMHFTDKIIPSKYREVCSIVEKQLVAVDKCTMTCGLPSINSECIFHSRCTSWTMTSSSNPNVSRNLKYQWCKLSSRKCFPQCSSPRIFLKRYVGPQPTIVVILWMLLARVYNRKSVQLPYTHHLDRMM